MINALAHTVTAVRAGWSYSQEWLSCARVLVNRLVNPQPVRAPSANVHVADQQCAVLQKPRFNSYLEQPCRMGWHSGFGRTQN